MSSFFKLWVRIPLCVETSLLRDVRTPKSPHRSYLHRNIRTPMCHDILLLSISVAPLSFPPSLPSCCSLSSKTSDSFAKIASSFSSCSKRAPQRGSTPRWHRLRATGPGSYNRSWLDFRSLAILPCMFIAAYFSTFGKLHYRLLLA